MKAKLPHGRPSKYTEAIADEMCYRLSDGEPLRAICRDDHMPAWRTVYDWMSSNEEFSARIARGRDLGMDAILEDTLKIADTPMVGVRKKYESGVVTEAVEEDMLGHRKLQIETRLKLLAKWNPKKYGDKVENTHKGDVNAPLQLILNGSDVNG